MQQAGPLCPLIFCFNKNKILKERVCSGLTVSVCVAAARLQYCLVVAALRPAGAHCGSVSSDSGSPDVKVLLGSAQEPQRLLHVSCLEEVLGSAPGSVFQDCSSPCT